MGTRLRRVTHDPHAAPTYPGFPDTETGEFVLTHPLTGYYHRRDGRLGSYSIWHPRLTLSQGQIRSAQFGLLDRLGILPFSEQTNPYSVLIQPQTEFIVHLPPKPC